MKARIKKTGEIANIADYSRVVLESCDSWGNPLEYPLDEVEIIEERADDIDWEQRRYEVAREVLAETVKLSHHGVYVGTCGGQAKIAGEYADALIAELKKGGNEMNSIWIARDKDGTLCAYNQKPYRIAFDDIWLPENGNDWNYEVLNDDWFPEVTWENSPIELAPKIMIDKNTSLEDKL